MLTSEMETAIADVRRVLTDTVTTEQERADFVYRLVDAVYAHVKLNVPGSNEERTRLAKIKDEALPPVPKGL